MQRRECIVERKPPVCQMREVAESLAGGAKVGAIPTYDKEDCEEGVETQDGAEEEERCGREDPGGSKAICRVEWLGEKGSHIVVQGNYRFRRVSAVFVGWDGLVCRRDTHSKRRGLSICVPNIEGAKAKSIVKIVQGDQSRAQNAQHFS